MKKLYRVLCLARVGDYTYSDFAVCFRDNTNWCAASTPVTTQWGETKQPLFQNHAVSITKIRWY